MGLAVCPAPSTSLQGDGERRAELLILGCPCPTRALYLQKAYSLTHAACC